MFFLKSPVGPELFLNNAPAEGFFLEELPLECFQKVSAGGMVFIFVCGVVFVWKIEAGELLDFNELADSGFSEAWPDEALYLIY